MAISKEVKVGLLALVSGMILYFGFNFLKGSDLLSSTKKYKAVYSNVGGLTPSNPVTINGFSVGRVANIEILQNRNNYLLVTFEVDRKIQLTDSAEVVLSDDLLGGKSLVLNVGRGSRILENNDTVRSSRTQGLGAVLKEKALPVLDNVDSMLTNLNQVVKKFDSTGYILNKTLHNFQQTSESLNGVMADNRQQLKGTLANFNRLSASLVETEKELKPLLRKFNTIADTVSQMKLAQAVDNANRSIANLNAILAEVNAGKGTLGKMAKDDSLYANLNRSAADLDKLFIDLRKNPKRYVNFSLFGGGGNKKTRKVKKTKEVIRE